MIDSDIIADTELAMKVCSMGRAARSKSAVKVRQPSAGSGGKGQVIR